MGKHQKTLEAVFTDPVRPNIKWLDIEAMLRHRGAKISQGSGSRVRVTLNNVQAVFHAPHPSPDTDKGAVKSVRSFLTSAGVTP